MDRLFSFLLRNKSDFSFKNRSRTGKTDDFSSPDLSTYIFKNKKFNQELSLVILLILSSSSMDSCIVMPSSSVKSFQEINAEIPTDHFLVNGSEL